VAELKDLADEEGIEVPNGALKADIVKAIAEHQAGGEEEKAEKKVEETKEEIKETVKEKPKAKAAKKEAKAAKKAVKGEGEKGGGEKVKDAFKKFDAKMDKVGYVDAYDYITLAAGIWGLIWTLVLFFWYLGGTVPGFQGASGLTAPFMTDASNNAWAALFLFIMMFWVYINLILYPLLIDKVYVKVTDSKSFPLHFINTKEDLRAFIIFLSFWSLIFFSVAGWALRWPHIISLIIVGIVMLVDPLSAKWSKIPAKEIRE